MASTWPLWLRRLLEETTIHFAQCYEIARQRVLGDPSSFKRLMAERDDALLDAKLLRREIAVLRRNRAGLPHRKRPDYSPENRLEILQIMKLRGWSLRMTAHHFVLHYNTVWNWNRAWNRTENVDVPSGFQYVRFPVRQILRRRCRRRVLEKAPCVEGVPRCSYYRYGPAAASQDLW